MEAKQISDMMEAYVSIYEKSEEQVINEDLSGTVDSALKKTGEALRKVPVVSAVLTVDKGKGRKTPTKTSGGYRPVAKEEVETDENLISSYEEINEFRNVGLPGRGPLDKIANFFNPPGPLGGPRRGPRFGNPPGPLGGPGRGPRFGNPPGPLGGPGRGPRFGNPPGPLGGPGRGPRFGNPPGPLGGPGSGNPPGPLGGPRRGLRFGNPPGPLGGPGRGPRFEEIETDIFDVILEHLVAEGYADTNQAALAIMANMSEEWKQSIVEGGINFSVPSRIDDFNNRRDELKNRYKQDVGPRIPGPGGGGQYGEPSAPKATGVRLARGTSSSNRGTETKNNA